MDLWGVEALWRGVLIGLAAAAPIGPVNLICIHRTISRGRINALMAGQGAAIGDGLFAIVAAFGITAVSSFIAAYEVPIQFVGGFVLLGMGIRALLTDPTTVKVAGDDTALDLVKAVGVTFSLTVTNPATMFGFAAIFAGVGGLVAAQPDGAPRDYVYAAMLVFGVWLGSTLWWLVITNLAAIFRDRAEQSWLIIVQRVSAGLIILFGLVVFAKLAGLITF